jgi:8-amino-7-oxononanoate synthase
MNPYEMFVDHFRSQGMYPEFHAITAGVNEPVCEVNGEQYLLFCANNYLGLTQHPEVKDAAKAAIDAYGMGPGGSRVISGSAAIITELEQKIATLIGTEDCLTFPTGYMANVAVFRALMDPLFGDFPVQSEQGVIFSDEFNHGSIVDGCKLTKAKKVIFKHNDLADLEQKLQENNLPNKLIVTEGVFSLDGEIIPVPDYIALAKHYNARLMIDDAHGVGILGEHGGGVGELFNCSQDIDILMGCMDKAFGGTGGYLGGTKKMVDYLRIACRSSLLSSALTTSMAGAMIASTKLIREGGDWRSELFQKSAYLRQKLRDAGLTVMGPDNLPAIALFVGDDRTGIAFAEALWNEHIFSPVVRWPAVPMNQSRFRIIVMVNHTYEQLDQFAEAAIRVARSLALIP